MEIVRIAASATPTLLEEDEGMFKIVVWRLRGDQHCQVQHLCLLDCMQMASMDDKELSHVDEEERWGDAAGCIVKRRRVFSRRWHGHGFALFGQRCLRS
jgi:hypothetical protein